MLQLVDWLLTFYIHNEYYAWREFFQDKMYGMNKYSQTFISLAQ